MEPSGEAARKGEAPAASGSSKLRTSSWMSVQRMPEKAHESSASVTPTPLTPLPSSRREGRTARAIPHPMTSTDAQSVADARSKRARRAKSRTKAGIKPRMI
eukprot:6623759-Prymnesium_polylepis.1